LATVIVFFIKPIAMTNLILFFLGKIKIR